VDCAVEKYVPAVLNLDGCRGASKNTGLRYVLRSQRLSSEEAAPYTGKDGPCNYDDVPNAYADAYIRQIKSIMKSDRALQEAAIKGAVSVGIKAGASLMAYKVYISNVQNHFFYCRFTSTKLLTINELNTYFPSVWNIQRPPRLHKKRCLKPCCHPSRVRGRGRSQVLDNQELMGDGMGRRGKRQVVSCDGEHLQHQLVWGTQS